jgi:hypothetical protein
MLRITRIAKDWGGTLHDLHPHLVVWIWSLLLLLQMGLAFLCFASPCLQDSGLPAG